MWGDCLDGVGRLSGGLLRLLESMGRLSEVCLDAVLKVWGGCLDGEGRLSSGSGEAIWGV